MMPVSFTVRGRQPSRWSPPSGGSTQAGQPGTEASCPSRAQGGPFVPLSISCRRRARYRLSTGLPHWGLWELPRAAIAWFLATHALLVIWTASILYEDAQRHDLLRFFVLLACATAYVVVTREPEERRRAHEPSHAYVDQTSVWVFSGALVLPGPLILVLVALVRSGRFVIARKPPATFLMTSSAIAISALGAHLVAAATGLRTWLTGQRPWPQDAVGLTVVALSVAAAMIMYFLAQAILIGVARGLITGSWSLEALIGDRTVNKFILMTLMMAVCAAGMQALAAPFLLVMAPIAMRSTRNEHRLQQALIDRERLRRDALHDPLTGLPNRRGFEPAAQLTLVTDQAAEQPTAVLMIDLDHFKAWNDRLGHIGADQVLTAVADTLRTTTRQTDLICRWGGEELAVMLPSTGREEAMTVAENLRAAVATRQIDVTKPAGGQKIRLNSDVGGCTTSIGVAVTPDHGTTLLELQEHADTALAQAKLDGRNRVTLAPPSVMATTPASMSRRHRVVG